MNNWNRRPNQIKDSKLTVAFRPLAKQSEKMRQLSLWPKAKIKSFTWKQPENFK